MGALRKNLFASLFGVVLSASVFAETLYQENFDNGILPINNFSILDSKASLGISVDKFLNLNGSSGSIKGNYPAPYGTGGYYIWAGHILEKRNLQELYIEFDAKMPGAKHGLKFLKIFSQNDGTSGYANTTFGLDYTGVDYGGMYFVGFGDGTSKENDTQNVILFTGQYPQYIGRSYGKATVLTPQKKNWSSSNWGTSWHHFKFHIKFNSGTTSATQINDGEYYVEIDGVVYVNAKGLFNRHYLNKPIDRVEFFGWSQSGSKAFEIWYDNIRITTDGFANKPDAPANAKIIN